MASPIYEMSPSYFDDDGCLIRRLRRTPTIAFENLMLFFNLLELVMQNGVGLDNVDPAMPNDGFNPVVMVRWSDDGGRTWENEEWLELGQIGEFRKRLQINSMGRSRSRVYEVVMTEPVFCCIVDGFLTYSVGTRL